MRAERIRGLAWDVLYLQQQGPGLRALIAATWCIEARLRETPVAMRLI